MKTGDLVVVMEGASEWMKERGYWLDCIGDSIDGLIGPLSEDYTDLPGDASHWGVDLGFEYVVGVNQRFLVGVDA